MKETTKVYNIVLFKRLLNYISPYKLFFSVCIFSVLGLSIFGALRPVVLEKVVDQNLTAQISEGFLLYIIVIGLLLICEVISNYLFIYYASWLGQSVVKDIRVELFNHILNFKLKYYDKSSVGILITRAVTDMERIADIFGQGLFMILSDILKMLLVGIVMIIMNWKLSIIVFCTLPIILIATMIFQKYMKTAFDEVRTEVANLNSFVQERVTGMKVLQLFAREEIEYLKFKKINERHKKAWLKTVWYNSIFFPVAEILSSLTLGVVVWYGGMNNILYNLTSLGELTAFIMMIPMMFRPLNQIANKFNTLLMGMVAAERVFKVLDTESNIDESGNKIVNNLRGDIQFKNIHFSYNESEIVLKNISFEIKAGTTTAIVGSTGAGKSTVINLINRFYEINSGDILIDGTNIKEFALSSLRNQIGFVSQDVHLFSDTILHNITLNNSNISFDQVKRASAEIGVHDFVKTLPNGYNYNVRERGIMLSTGQRQLISFLRAYVTDPRILIQKAIEKMTNNRTSLVIAHRLSTIRNADNIIVMNLGEIVEQGTHQELLKINGYYKNLYDTQLKSQKNMELV